LEPWRVVWLVDCQSALVPISFASQSRDSGAVWRWDRAASSSLAEGAAGATQQKSAGIDARWS
jgi:hypothetical protein